MLRFFRRKRFEAAQSGEKYQKYRLGAVLLVKCTKSTGGRWTVPECPPCGRSFDLFKLRCYYVDRIPLAPNVRHRFSIYQLLFRWHPPIIFLREIKKKKKKKTTTHSDIYTQFSTAHLTWRTKYQFVHLYNNRLKLFFFVHENYCGRQF